MADTAATAATAAPALRRIRVETRAAPDAGEGRFEALVSDYTTTYDIGWGWQERILPGAFADSIAANPAIPICWEHDWQGGPIGHGEASEHDHGLIVRGELYMDDPQVARIWRSMQARAVNEWSIAFFPERIVNDEREKYVDQIEKGDLVEATACFRGANPGTETLDLRSRPVYIDGGETAAQKEVVRLRKLFSVPDIDFRPDWTVTTSSTNGLIVRASTSTNTGIGGGIGIDLDARAAIASHSTATSSDTWDGPQNKANLKTDQDASYYRQAFAWQDPDGDPSTKAAYRFIHHEVSADGSIGAANTTACSTGIGVLNGGRGGTTIPDADRSGVYNHLKKHLTDAGKEAPELQSAAVAAAVRSLLERSDNTEVDSLASNLDRLVDQLLKALGITDDDSDDASRARAGHGPVDTTHTHPHSAMGSQGGDETHEHEHTHSGDANHDHHADNAATDPAMMSRLLSSRWGFELLRDLVSRSATSAPTTTAPQGGNNA
jgi:HK97 family phage prohead protease